MKKLMGLFLMIISLFGCSLSNMPSNEVEKYLENLKNLSDAVIIDVDSRVSEEELTKENKEIYKKALLRQYENMKYNIKNESINGNDATVKVQITVYNYYKVNEMSNIYMNEHLNEFNDMNGFFSNDIYNTFRLGELLKATDTISYELVFNLKKDTNGNWVLENPNREMLEKINGLYIN